WEREGRGRRVLEKDPPLRPGPSGEKRGFLPRCGACLVMAERVSIPCPNCGRILLIPHRILGRGGRCRHCGHQFRAPVQGDSDQELSLSSYCCPPLEAGAPGESDPMLSSSTTTVLAPVDTDRLRAAPRPELFQALASACRRLVARVGERAG